MDIVLHYCDEYAFDKVYPHSMSRENIWRQVISLLTIVNIGGFLIYMIPTTLSYYFLFDKRHLNHPQILEASRTENCEQL